MPVMKKIDWSTVVRFSKPGNDGKPVLAADDAIAMSPVTAEDVAETFHNAGLWDLPEEWTWVELTANWNYCERLEFEVQRLKKMSHEGKQRSFKVYEYEHPNFAKVMKLVLKLEEDEDALEELAALHDDLGAFIFNTQNPIYRIEE